MPSNNIFKKVGIASFIMMASVFASRVIGVFREMTIAGTSGIEASVDAYQIAFILPEILNHVVASGFLSITFIPIFSAYIASGKTGEGYHVFSIIFNTFGLLLLVLIAVSMIWADRLVLFFAPGISDPHTLALATKMTRIILPAQFFFFSGGLFMAVQFANEKFFIPALAPLIYNLFIILGGLLIAPTIGMEGFAWGVLAGAFFGNFLVQIWGSRKVGLSYSLLFKFTHPDLIRYICLTLPLMIGLTMTFSTEILLKFFGSYLPPGSIAAMNYSLRIMFLLVGIFGQAVGTASYPYLARLAQMDNLDELNGLLNKTLTFIFLVIPVSTFFMVYSREIVVVLFQRGSFDMEASMITAGILPFFMVGAFAFSAQNMVSRGYYATQNTLFPAIFSTLAVLVSLPIIYIGMNYFKAKGLASGLSLCVIIQCFLLYECWNKKSQNHGKKAVYAFFLKIIPISAGLLIIQQLSVLGLRSFINTMTFKGAFTALVITGIEFLFLFFLVGMLFKIDEIKILYCRVFERIPLWKTKSDRSVKK